MTGAPDYLQGLSGLSNARHVNGAEDLKPFEYLRNDGQGNYYAQNSLSNPNEGGADTAAPVPQQPQAPSGPAPGAGGPSPVVDSQQQMMGPRYGGIGRQQQMMQLLQRMGRGQGSLGRQGGGYPMAPYGNTQNIPSAYSRGIGRGYPGQQQPYDDGGGYQDDYGGGQDGYGGGYDDYSGGSPGGPMPFPQFPQAGSQTGGGFGSFNPTGSGGISRGSFMFRRGGAVRRV